MQLHQSTVVSGQQSVDFASQAILAGDMDVVVAGGVESISRLKTGSDATPALTQIFNLGPDALAKLRDSTADMPPRSSIVFTQ